MLNLVAKTKKQFVPQSLEPLTRGVIIALAVVILVTAALRIRLLNVPLERDEGEYAYMGQLILNGIPPYQLAYNMKLPGVYAAYAMVMAVFGQTTLGIHLGLMVVNAASSVVLFFLARRLLGQWPAVTAVAAFAFLGLSFRIQGFTANAEPFVILPALAGILLLVKNEQSDRHSLTLIALAGLLMGIAFLVKQQAIGFVFFAGLILFVRCLKIRPITLKSFAIPLTVFIFAFAVPYILTCLILYAAGVFDKFWYWTVTYARVYAGRITFEVGMILLKKQLVILLTNLAIWGLAAVGLITIWVFSHPRRWFLAGFAVCALATVSIGFYFRAHYFIFFLPACALLAAVGFEKICQLIRHVPMKRFPWLAPVLLGAAVVAVSLYQQWGYLFKWSPLEISREMYSCNPFPESETIGKYIREHSQPTDRIAVIGSEPQIYFFADRRSATGHIYTYALMELHSLAKPMQREMIQEIETAQPEFMVLVDVFGSWMTHPDSCRDIINWSQNYVEKFYYCVGVVKIPRRGAAQYLWGEKAIADGKRGESEVFIYRKKPR